nr:PfkB family carbohydrate kinase [Streptomyces mirabilis]
MTRSRGGTGHGLPALVIGEALVDIIAGPDGPRRSHPGGSPANVALGLGRLGHPVRLATRVGTDPHGRLVREHLEDGGVELAPGSEAGAATSTATAVLWDASHVPRSPVGSTPDLPAPDQATSAFPCARGRVEGFSGFLKSPRSGLHSFALPELAEEGHGAGSRTRSQRGADPGEPGGAGGVRDRRARGFRPGPCVRPLGRWHHPGRHVASGADTQLVRSTALGHAARRRGRLLWTGGEVCLAGHAAGIRPVALDVLPLPGDALPRRTPRDDRHDHHLPVGRDEPSARSRRDRAAYPTYGPRGRDALRGLARRPDDLPEVRPGGTELHHGETHLPGGPADQRSPPLGPERCPVGAGPIRQAARPLRQGRPGLRAASASGSADQGGGPAAALVHRGPVGLLR